jgi:AP endonuclease-2
VIVEFPGMVIIGVYCPANRDESRDDFRIGFLNALDSRVRNLISMGKHVILTGDLNIIREEMDTANAEEQLKKHGMTGEEYVSTPARRMLNQLLVGGKVMGERDEDKEGAVMWDICRGFHPKRKGMFTCWEQKINARPGNFGSRIDYVLCSWDCYDWFQDSNIQEGLMGSDHCPVYATFKDKVEINGKEVYVKDLFSDGMFNNGVRQREWTIKDLLPTSAKLIPEFDRRRSIRDMFTKKPSLPAGESSMTNGATSFASGRTTPIRELPRTESVTPNGDLQPGASVPTAFSTSTVLKPPPPSSAARKSPPKQNGKRPLESSNTPAPPQKWTKSSTPSKAAAGSKGSPVKSQSSLMGFFKPKVQPVAVQTDQDDSSTSFNTETDIYTADDAEAIVPTNLCPPKPDSFGPPLEKSVLAQDIGEETENKPFNLADQEDVVDPVAAKASKFSRFYYQNLLLPDLFPFPSHES